MRFDSFTMLIKKEVEKYLSSSESCTIKKVSRNNGIEVTGLFFMHEEINISPTVYLDRFYEEYINGKISIEETVKEIITVYEKSKFEHKVDMSGFFEYENIKDHIIFKLVNFEKNEKFLQDIPYIKFFDLAVIFSVLISDDKFGSASIQITNFHQDIWKVSTKDIYKQAIINTPMLRKAEIKNMKSVLSEIIMKQGMDTDMISMLDNMQNVAPMYILSNRDNINGAGCILYPGILKRFGEAIDGDFYIIPASIHEVILLPIMAGDDFEGLKEIIHDVNEHEISSEEILSDSLYVYRKDIDSVEIMSEEVIKFMSNIK